MERNRRKLSSDKYKLQRILKGNLNLYYGAITESDKQTYFDKFYHSLRTLSERVVAKYYGKRLNSDAIDEVVTLWIHDFTIKVIISKSLMEGKEVNKTEKQTDVMGNIPESEQKEKKPLEVEPYFSNDIKSWALFIKSSIRLYLPFHRRHSKREIVSDYEFEGIQDDKDSYASIEIDSILESVFSKYFDNVKDHLPFSSKEIKNVSHFLAVYAVFLDVDVSAILTKRLGFYISYLREEFVNIIQTELLDD